MRRKTKLMLLIFLIIAIFLAAIGLTFAYFSAQIQGNDNENTSVILSTSSLGITYDSGNMINVNKILPGWSETKTFTVKSNATSIMIYHINWEEVINTFETKSDLIYELSGYKTLSETECPSVDSPLYENIEINPGEIHTYTLTITFKNRDEAQNENMGKIFSARIIISTEPVKESNKLADKILNANKGVLAIESKGNPNFNYISTADDTGMYAAEDDYGTTYYFRGNKEILNNNVIFAGFQWKVIRINGDRSVRMVYNGTKAQFVADKTVNKSGTATQIGVSSYNPGDTNNKYTSYVYDNSINSNAKTSVEAWYKTNIYDKDYDNYIADVIFCNDKSGLTSFNHSGGYIAYTYNVVKRLRLNISAEFLSSEYPVPTPSFKCAQKVDSYTKTQTDTTNGKLAHKVGLLTSDELVAAGAKYDTSNLENYLNTSSIYWIMSPPAATQNYTYGAQMGTNGSFTNSLLNSAKGIRPVINLSSDIEISSGDGSSTDPYVIE